MKKSYYIFLLIGFLFGCANDEYVHKKTKHLKKQYVAEDATFHRVESKYAYRFKPSESMQAGPSKRENYYDFTQKEDKSDNVYEVSNDDLEANPENYKGVFKVGNPYQIFGVSYFPQNYEDFEEVGTASWYGDDFHGRPTANGEIYDMQEMTAAHPTLPLPSLVKVTNTRNGKSVIVRVNDRGPFAKSRIIDVSEKAADALGFKAQGTTEVKIELLRSDTDRMLEKLKIKN